MCKFKVLKIRKNNLEIFTDNCVELEHVANRSFIANYGVYIRERAPESSFEAHHFKGPDCDRAKLSQIAKMYAAPLQI